MSQNKDEKKQIEEMVNAAKRAFELYAAYLEQMREAQDAEDAFEHDEELMRSTEDAVYFEYGWACENT